MNAIETLIEIASLAENEARLLRGEDPYDIYSDDAHQRAVCKSLQQSLLNVGVIPLVTDVGRGKARRRIITGIQWLVDGED